MGVFSRDSFKFVVSYEYKYIEVIDYKSMMPHIW